MVRRSIRVVALGVVGVVAAVGAWNLYQRYTTERVPYTVVARLGDVELRRYPPAVVVETVAATESEAFGRLFGYLSGANDAGDDLAMTAPVEVAGRGREIAMTVPVEATDRPEGVRMAFYLPASYDAESAPRPTDDDVDLVAVPERTLAVRRFGWVPTDRRVARETDRLVEGLERAEVELAGDPFFMGYEAPWTLPVLRRNEVAVEVDTRA